MICMSHLERDVLSGIGVAASVIAAAGNARGFGELPDPATLVRTC